MNKKGFLAVLTVIFILVGAGLALADDVVNSTEDVGSIYADHKAFKVGDIVTVLVIESTTGSQSANLSTSKQQKMDAGMGMSAWGGGVSSVFPNVPSWGAGAEEFQDGGGKSVRAGSLMAKISAKVERVLSNGNLIIKGTKVIQINDDKQNLVITGTIRPEDIASDNTIASTNVADAQIEYEGKGPVGEKSSPGIITRILDWLGIF
jgi:flagellar L-ring protein precursor FlgH